MLLDMQNHFQTWLGCNVWKWSECVENTMEASRFIWKYTLKSCWRPFCNFLLWCQKAEQNEKKLNCPYRSGTIAKLSKRLTMHRNHSKELQNQFRNLLSLTCATFKKRFHLQVFEWSGRDQNVNQWIYNLEIKSHMVSKLIGSVFKIFGFKLCESLSRCKIIISNMGGRECAKVIRKDRNWNRSIKRHQKVYPETFNSF